MKQKVLYQCEICMKEYQKESAASACENNHLKPKKVEKPIYSAFDDKPNYPESVNIIFSDGRSARYYRKLDGVKYSKEW